jgi:hypothetical protein
MHEFISRICCPALIGTALALLCAPTGSGESLDEMPAWRVIPGQDVCVMIARATAGQDDALVVSLIWRKEWPAGSERTLIFIEATYLVNGGKYVIAAPDLKRNLEVPTHDSTIVLAADYADKLRSTIAREAPWSITVIALNGTRRQYAVPTSGARDAITSFDTCERRKKRGDLVAGTVRHRDLDCRFV